MRKLGLAVAMACVLFGGAVGESAALTWLRCSVAEQGGANALVFQFAFDEQTRTAVLIAPDGLKRQTSNAQISPATIEALFIYAGKVGLDRQSGKVSYSPQNPGSQVYGRARTGTCEPKP